MTLHPQLRVLDNEPPLTFTRESLAEPNATWRNAEWAVKLLWPSLSPGQQELLSTWFRVAEKTIKDLHDAEWVEKTRANIEEEILKRRAPLAKKIREHDELMAMTDKLLEDF